MSRSAIDSDAALTAARTRFGWARLGRVREAADDHFWHGPRRRLMLDLLLRDGLARGDAALLDVGCGDGRLVQALCDAGLQAFGLDPWADAQGLDPVRFRTGTLPHLPWPDDSFGTLCALDVIEHLDDVAALAEMRRVLMPGGGLLLSVPAHAWLWSARDTAAGHLRRYTRRMLAEHLEAAGFRVERLIGFQFALLPLLALSRLRARGAAEHGVSDAEDRPGAGIHRVLHAINLLEVRLGRWLRPPTGSSLVAIARRPEHAAGSRAA